MAGATRTDVPGPAVEPASATAGVSRRWPVRKSAALPATLALGLALVIVVGHLWAMGADLSVFVRAAPPFAQLDKVPPSLRLVEPDQVYDGQYFYQLAIDPWVTQAAGISFDNPSYRQQRILYPLIAHLLSAGRVDWLPFVLVAINVAGLVVLGVLGACFAMRLGEPAWWACLLPLWAGFTYSLARDLSEIVGACCLVGTLLALKTSRPLLAAGCMALAVLTRETAVILALAIFTWSVQQRIRWRRMPADPAWLVGLTGLMSYVGLQVALWARWGTPPLLAGSANLAMPLSGPLFYWGIVGQLGRLELAFFVLLVMLGLAAPRVPGFVRLALVGYLAMLLALSTTVWGGDTAWLRAGTEAGMLASLAVLHGGRRRLLTALAASSALWPAVARWAITT